jgi:outer membrane immunogenic protein
MNKNTTYLVGAAVLFACFSPALGDGFEQKNKSDLFEPVVSPASTHEDNARYDWTGLYAGVSAGMSLANVDHYYDRQNGNNDHGQVWIDAAGMNASALVGYNHHLGNNWVIGAEAELGFIGLNEEEIVIKDDDVLRIDTGMFGTARFRAGYAFDRFLPYVTGGVGFIDIENNGGNPANAARYNVVEDVRFALAFGVGADYAFTDNIVGRIEYLHLNTAEFEDRNLENEMMSWDNDINMLRAAMTYRFN